ncbi:hypothetical protein BDV59DRAFT_200952 [Aspergillus ambiguus]|uniref:uncharacterized protein n=1 Tax=Aspergillus ambiguus TaxID=176160 RepID=UPI003CCD2A10
MDHLLSEITISTQIERLSAIVSDVIREDHFQKLGLHVKNLNLEAAQSDFFKPLTDDFLARHPLSGKNISSDRPKWMPVNRLGRIVTNLGRHIAWLKRDNIVYGGTLIDTTSWYNVNDNSLIPLADVYDLKGLGLERGRHSLDAVFHCTDQGFPHVIMVARWNKESYAGERDLMRHELLYMLRAMEVRHDEEVFKRGEPQPVLLISFLAPQHARVLQAYIKDGTRLVIGRSRKYAFEKGTGSFELFVRWLLATPVGVEPVEVPCIGSSSNNVGSSKVFNFRPRLWK